MPRHVNVLVGVDHDVGTASGDVVHDPTDRFFVAWNDPGRKGDRVSPTDSHVAMVVNRDSGQGGQRLALRARADAQDIRRGVFSHVRVLDLEASRDLQDPQTTGDPRRVLHAAADKGDLAAKLLSEIDQELQPIQARRECRDDQQALGGAEDVLEAIDDVALRAGHAAPIRVRTVRKQGQNTVSAKFREPVQVHRLAIDRGLIDLEVAGVDDHASRRVNRHGQAVRHAVRHTKELHPNGANRVRIARAHREQPVRMVDAVLVQLRPHKCQRQLARQHRARNPVEHMCNGADVILVAVSQHQRPDASLPRVQYRQVRDNQVDPEQLRFGEHHTGIDDDGRLATGDQDHVHPEFAQPTDRDDVYGRRTGRCNINGLRQQSVPSFRAFHGHTRAANERTPQRVASARARRRTAPGVHTCGSLGGPETTGVKSAKL